MSQRILVTGGTGFLGGHVLELLLKRGYSPRVLARGAATAGRTHSDPRIEWIEGSILSREDLRRALSGCAAVVHLAGRVSRDRRDLADLRELHVEGTRAVIGEAHRAGVTRVVYASTSGTVGCTKDPDARATEAIPHSRAPLRRWPYYATKLEAETRALATARELGVELVCLNPSLLLGPGDTRLSSTEDVHNVVKGRIPAVPSGGLNFVDVRDVAQAFVAALSRGRPGERYLLGGANWSFRRFVDEIGAIAQVPVPRFRAPDLLTRIIARVVEALCRWMGRRAALDLVSAEMSQYYWYLDSAKARAELGFVARAPEVTLRDTITTPPDSA